MIKKELVKTVLSTGVADRETALKVDSLQSGFVAGKIDRRGFMTGAVALGLSMTAATSFVNEVQAATPKKGGRIRTALTGGATSDTLDPGQILDLYMLCVQFGQARNNLTEVNAVASLSVNWLKTGKPARMQQNGISISVRVSNLPMAKRLMQMTLSPHLITILVKPPRLPPKEFWLVSSL